MNFDNPSKDGSVEKLLDLCEILREGTMSRDELYEGVDQSNSLVSNNIKYGLDLGFLEETEEGIKTTPRGVEASYNQETPADLALQFQEGLKEYQLYRVALQELTSEYAPTDSATITKSDILRIFRTSIGLEGSESTLGDAATTYIQTLEAANLGKYIVGRGGKETRLEVAEKFNGLVEENIITQNSCTEPESTEEESENLSPSEREQDLQSISDVESSLFQINLDLSGDENPSEVEELIIGVRRGLSRNLSKADASGRSENSKQESINKNDEEGSKPTGGSETTSLDQSLETFVKSEPKSKSE